MTESVIPSCYCLMSDSSAIRSAHSAAEHSESAATVLIYNKPPKLLAMPLMAEHNHLV